MSAEKRIDPSVSVDDTSVDELGPLAEQAAHAVRMLVHQTRPAVGGLNEPAQAAQLLAVLAELTGMLPQLLDHLQRWLLDQHRHGRLCTDHSVPPRSRTDDADPGAAGNSSPDAGPAVRAAAVALSRAGACLHQAGHALQSAHQHTAHLAITDDVLTVLDVTDDVLGGGALPEPGWGQR